ncbi:MULTISPECIES: hypothetical protein [Vibrio]|uniref:Uncharacterized protein n=1 Tax=Vibrio parahaemolyticus TaxID=670 RepID=A0AA47JN72_VIBPH|nr:MULTISPECIES: hypothetical protein [Vibrio]MBE3780036.1 hypothetical protein [Vibrio parahaemolyticus]MBE4231418.1 hypothetical protein [Vibrio parahaemolyticus]MCZ6249622.1 hypothetical protein [Vibrio parahaemolyticus]MCZ6279365.1 hypothetical protein [Vibrio parahaemolyticus]MCZ6417380.1 hypothetical protein [Vibrio parahaemolyticus]
MKPIRPIFIVFISTLLLTFLMGIFVEIVRGCIDIPSSIWLYCLAISILFTAVYHWLEHKGKTAIFLTKEYQALNLLMGAVIIAIAYTYSLSAAALLLIVCGLALIIDCAYRYSHIASKTDKQT